MHAMMTKGGFLLQMEQKTSLSTARPTSKVSLRTTSGAVNALLSRAAHDDTLAPDLTDTRHVEPALAA